MGRPRFEFAGTCLCASQLTDRRSRTRSWSSSASIGADELLGAEPETYYTKEHYESYPSVLVRLSRVHPDALRDLLRIAYDVAAAKPKKKSTPRRRRPVKR
jgi:hypothetical protein